MQVPAPASHPLVRPSFASPAHEPRQQRSRATLERLLDAGEALLLERGYDSLTVGDVVSRAGSSVGSFYARFPGKEALLDALHQRFASRFYDVTDALGDPALWAAVPVADQVRAWVASMVQYTATQRRLMRAFTVAGTGDDEMRARAAELFAYAAASMVETIRPRIREVRHPEPELALRLTYTVVAGTLNWLLVFEADDATPFPLDADVLTRELARMALRYLGLDSEENPS